MTYPAENEETYPYTVEFNHPTDQTLSKYMWMHGLMTLREAGKELIKVGSAIN